MHAAEVADLCLTLARQEEQLQSQKRELDQLQQQQLMSEEEGRDEEEVAPATEKVIACACLVKRTCMFN